MIGELTVERECNPIDSRVDYECCFTTISITFCFSNVISRLFLFGDGFSEGFRELVVVSFEF